MDWMRYSLLLVGALSFAWCGRAAFGPNNWLSPDCTATSPYTFVDRAGMTIQLPSLGTYKEWSVLNAASPSSEATKSYAITTEAALEGAGMLRLADGGMADEQAYLSLGISTNSTDALQTPLDLMPVVPGPAVLRVDSIYAKVRFAQSDATPNVDDLKAMYPTYADSQPDVGGNLPTPSAAKLGVCVLQDGYFYVSRVRSGTPQNPGTGVPQDFIFEFCKTKYTYKEFGEGAVTVRIEFWTFSDGRLDEAYARAFRIWVKRFDAPDTDYVCITRGRGYEWLNNADTGYGFDFSSLEKGDWFYAVDSAWAATGAKVGVSGIDNLRQLGFSASDGGFYSAWIEANRTVNDSRILSAYDTGKFAGFVDAPGAFFDLYVDWAARYSVTLTDYLTEKGGASLMGANDVSEKAYNAFLLDMDPALEVVQQLSVTGIVPEGDTVTLTVRGPEGCDLRTANTRAARICVRRSSTLDGLASAPPVYYAPQLSFDAQGHAIFVLPKTENNTELPFMQVTLVPVTEL